jgi:AraC family transcriptional regulator
MRPFSIVETNGILALPSTNMRASSDDLNWTSLYVSSQVEAPFEGVFEARDTLIVAFRNGGAGTNRLGGRGTPWSGAPGTLRIIPGGQQLELTLTSTSETVHLYVRRQILEEVAADMVDGDPQGVNLQLGRGLTEPVLFRLVDAAESAMLAGHREALYSDWLSRAIAARLIQSHTTVSLKRVLPNASGQSVSRDVSTAIDYMASHLDQNISLAELARTSNRSPSHLSRLFGIQMGVPPHRYLIQMRVSKARQLLEKTNIPIAEIAAICGFSHQEHLTRLFRRYHGVSPGAYRQTVKS